MLDNNIEKYYCINKNKIPQSLYSININTQLIKNINKTDFMINNLELNCDEFNLILSKLKRINVEILKVKKTINQNLNVRNTKKCIKERNI